LWVGLTHEALARRTCVAGAGAGKGTIVAGRLPNGRTCPVSSEIWCRCTGLKSNEASTRPKVHLVFHGGDIIAVEAWWGRERVRGFQMTESPGRDCNAPGTSITQLLRRAPKPKTEARAPCWRNGGRQSTHVASGLAYAGLVHLFGASSLGAAMPSAMPSMKQRIKEMRLRIMLFWCGLLVK
jgi:hypothetical protein